MPRDRTLAILIALCASYAIVCLATTPAGPLTSPDSAIYQAFSPIVPAGYPAFLKMAGERGAVVIQPVVYATALAFLTAETWLASSSVVLALTVLAACVAVPGLTTFHASILTESLFMSGLLAFLAAAIRFTREPSWRAAAAAATVAGLATTIRATGYAFFPVLIVMVLMERRRTAGRTVVVMLAATLPMLALAGGERIAARAIHGDRLTSLMGRHLFAKAGLIEAPPPADSEHDPLRDSLERQLDVAYAPIRGLIGRAPVKARAILTLFYETCLQGPCVRELGRRRPAARAR